MIVIANIFIVKSLNLSLIDKQRFLQVELTWQQNGNNMAMRYVSVKLDIVKKYPHMYFKTQILMAYQESTFNYVF
jgi:hypothetical protein